MAGGREDRLFQSLVDELQMIVCPVAVGATPTLMLRLTVLVLKLLEPIHVVIQNCPVALR